MCLFRPGLNLQISDMSICTQANSKIKKIYLESLVINPLTVDRMFCFCSFMVQLCITLFSALVKRLNTGKLILIYYDQKLKDRANIINILS